MWLELLGRGIMLETRQQLPCGRLLFGRAGKSMPQTSKRPGDRPDFRIGENGNVSFALLLRLEYDAQLMVPRKVVDHLTTGRNSAGVSSRIKLREWSRRSYHCQLL